MSGIRDRRQWKPKPDRPPSALTGHHLDLLGLIKQPFLEDRGLIRLGFQVALSTSTVRPKAA